MVEASNDPGLGSDPEPGRSSRATEVSDGVGDALQRSGAQLDMLHSLAANLNALGDIQEIGHAIAAELQSIVDYHNCRVYLLQPDGVTLRPIAFRGELFSEYAQETLEELETQVGEGITGWVAAHRESLNTPDARQVEFAVTITGTDEILESMLAVPMLAGDDVVGVIVLSSLDYAAFDEGDQRLLEVLAAHAAVAFDNAQLFQAEREAAETSGALFRLSQALTSITSVGDILQEAIETVPSIVACAAVGAYVRDAETGGFRLARLLELEGHLARQRASIADVPADMADRLFFSMTEPFTVPIETMRELPEGLSFATEPRESLIAPLRWQPGGLGALVLVATDREAAFGDRDLRVARGIADITSLALGNAERISELERSERQASEAFRREREATQRLRALDEMKNTFLEAVSHDLRTPLTSILGSALTLQQTQLDLPKEDALDLVHRITTNARKLERLLGDLLDLDRLQRGIVSPQRRPTDLAMLIRRGVEETENPAERPIEVDADTVTVSVDAAKVERILENLLSNALRHTPADARIWVRGRSEHGGVSIVVEDDGPGVPEAFKEAVFEPFSQAPGSSSEHSPGVGVGLSLVRRFAELHGGRAWVTERSGGGAAFHVFLPGG